MKGRKEEDEVIVRFDQVDQMAHICVSSWPSMDRKCLRLYGEPLPKSGRQAHYWLVPMKAVSFRRLSALGKATGRPFPARKQRAEGQSED